MLVGQRCDAAASSQHELLELFCPLFFNDAVVNATNDAVANATNDATLFAVKQHVRGLRSLPIAILVMMVESFRIKNVVICKNIMFIESSPLYLIDVCNYLASWHHEDFLIAAQEQFPELFKCINESVETCLSAIKTEGMTLVFVQDQTPEICMAAVQQNYHALQLVKTQTPEICITAVQQNPFAILWVKNITGEILSAIN